MYTRRDYLNGECSSIEYYSQLVRDNDAVSFVEGAFGKEMLIEAYKKEKNFSSIPLSRWDFLAPCMNVGFSKYGDLPTLSGQVCILKFAAEILVKRCTNEK